MNRVPGGPLLCLVPELVEAVALLEILHVALRIRQRIGGAGAGDEREPDEIGARQRPGVVHRDVREQRHAAVFDLPIAEQSLRAGRILHERPQQEIPMRGKARRAMLADEREILVALIVVGGREHRAVGGEPLRAQDAVTARAVLVPIGRIRAAEAIHRVLDVREIEVVGGDLDDQDDHVDVVEEAQVDMRDVER